MGSTMNKRIKELAEQVYGTQATEQEIKFAELILIEVTDILSTYRGKVVFEDGAEYNYEHPIIAIRKHFGVTQSNIEAAESIHSDKGYSLGTPEAQEAFERKRGYKL